MAIGGETNAIYWGSQPYLLKINPVEETQPPLGKAETPSGKITQRRVSESTNSAGEKEQSSTRGINTPPRN